MDNLEQIRMQQLAQDWQNSENPGALNRKDDHINLARNILESTEDYSPSLGTSWSDDPNELQGEIDKAELALDRHAEEIMKYYDCYSPDEIDEKVRYVDSNDLVGDRLVMESQALALEDYWERHPDRIGRDSFEHNLDQVAANNEGTIRGATFEELESKIQTWNEAGGSLRETVSSGNQNQIGEAVKGVEQARDEMLETVGQYSNDFDGAEKGSPEVIEQSNRDVPGDVCYVEEINLDEANFCDAGDKEIMQLEKDLDYAILSDLAYYEGNETSYGDYKCIGSVDKKLSGFHAKIFSNPNENEMVIAFRGTNKYSVVRDWVMTNAVNALGLHTMQYNQARNLARSLSEAYDTQKITLVGHSLGGGLAQSAAVDTGAKAVTFNAADPGVLNNFKKEASEGQIVRNYNLKEDPLDSVNKVTNSVLGTETEGITVELEGKEHGSRHVIKALQAEIEGLKRSE